MRCPPFIKPSLWPVLAAIAVIGADGRTVDWRDPASLILRDMESRGYCGSWPATTQPWTSREIRLALSPLFANADTLAGDYERQMVLDLSKRLGPKPASPTWMALELEPVAFATTGLSLPTQSRWWGLSHRSRGPDDHGRGIGRMDLWGELHPWVSYQVGMEADTDGLDDTDYLGPSFTRHLGSTATVTTAALRFGPPWLSVSFGRLPIVWGRGQEGSLILSHTAPSFDHLGIHVRLRHLWFDSFTAQLSSGGFVTATEGKTVSEIHRFLTAHRLVLKPSPWIEIGLSEMVIYGGPGRTLDWSKSNPVMWLFAEELNGEQDNDGLSAIDITLRYRRRAMLYGTLMVDDVSLDRRSPQRIGWQVGGKWLDPLGMSGSELGAEYVRLLRWVYTAGKRADHARFTNDGSLLGHPMGPDSDALYMHFRQPVYRNSKAVIYGTWRRRGETRVTTPEPVPPSAQFEYPNDPFPFGTVERLAGVGIRLSLQVRESLELAAGGEMQHIRNEGNVGGAHSWRTLGLLTLSYRWSHRWQLPGPIGF